MNALFVDAFRRPMSHVSTEDNRGPYFWKNQAYARGLARCHLLFVSSPWAIIFLASPKSSRQRSSFLILSMALLNCTVLLLGEKTSVQRTYPTPPCYIGLECIRRPRGQCAHVDVLTVSTRPTRTSPKLKLCCVARAAFSGIERSLHATYPSSLNGVTLRLLGPSGVGPWVFCVAYDRAKAEARRLLALKRVVAGRRATREVTAFILSSLAHPCPRASRMMYARSKKSVPRFTEYLQLLF